MPLKLLGMIILLILVTIFAGLNLDNRCDVNLIFHQLKNVPVFETVLVAFITGVVVMLPACFRRGGKSHPDSEDRNHPARSTLKERRMHE